MSLCVGLAAVLLACGPQNSYDAVENGLRDWLAAVEAGDPEACDLEAPGFHDRILDEHPELGGPGTTCRERLERMEQLALPGPDDEMDVGVWDPSGWAVVTVADPDGTLHDFDMAFRDGRWLVSRQTRPDARCRGLPSKDPSCAPTDFSKTTVPTKASRR